MSDSERIHEYFECQCSHPAHTLVVTHWREDREVYIGFFLNPFKGFFKRLKIAFQYLFQIGESQAGFDDFVLKPGDQKRFAEAILGKKLPEGF